METRSKRPPLEELDLPIGKKTRLHRLLYHYGPGNGTMLLLPIDQGLEHGPRDFFPNPDSQNPEFQLRLAKEGGYSGIVFHAGIAQKYMEKYAGEVPLVLKVNGKTEIPPDKHAFSPQTATVEDAVRLGADAIGYTLYVGSPAQAEDFRQFMKIREEAERFSMPIIIWAYPRGEAIEGKGGRDSLYAIDYAARVAAELGADVVKLNMPKQDEAKTAQCPKPYNTLNLSPREAIRKIIKSASRTMVLISGGEKVDDKELLEKAQICMEEGATGLIFGRNIWQRPYREALDMSKKIREMMKKQGEI